MKLAKHVMYVMYIPLYIRGIPIYSTVIIIKSVPEMLVPGD